MKISFLCFLVLCPLLTPAKQDDNPKQFPTTAEVNLLLTQSSRAMDTYAAIVAEAEPLMGKDGPGDAFAQDRQLISNWKLIEKALKAEPQKFNSRLGFDMVLTLDDASRNAALCATGALTHVMKDITNGKMDQSNVVITLSQNCTDNSTLLYTVSENAAALYEKYLSWQAQASGQMLDVIGKCSAAMKEANERKKQ
jgi:hypothetical protein